MRKSPRTSRRKASDPPVSKPVEVRRSKITAHLDLVDDTIVSGWAVDIEAPRQTPQLRILVDQILVDVMTCDRQRDDLKGLNLPSNRVGFSYVIPGRFLDGTRHVLSFAAVDGSPVTMSSRTGMVMKEFHFCLSQKIHFEGIVDGVVDGLIQGWAVRVDERTQAKTGGLRILVVDAGQPVAQLIADQYRGDVATALDADPDCGFSYCPPSDQRRGRYATLQFFIMPGKFELRGSPLEVPLPGDGERERINGLIARADELFGFAYHLRRELKAALPAERYLMSDYDRWARKALPLASARAIERYGALPEPLPLVSLICPVYRPAAPDFVQMVDSVRGQTYAHWELLIVDDASNDESLRGAMERLAHADDRIKLSLLPRNVGISKASNVAIRAAAGAFIAFLDHDDLLEPCALEVMIRAQARTGARLLYSDEDKIDRSGFLSEPHLKPDFNYRHLLEVNYICHFVMIERELVKQIGLLEPKFDGAQDHDFLLRACEITGPAAIHHVPEVLYHWRKTASSTAAAGGAKPGAARAGELAVAAHLKRRKINAKVSQRGDLTCYRVAWKPAETSRTVPRVTILIPFRDHIEMTAACVAAIRSNTETVDYSIMLLDNWSASAESEVFCAEQGNLPATEVVRIAEPFNYSRINNIGAARSTSDFLLFMNNDVFVSDPNWLRTMLNECLVNDRVAAVGAKLIYPNRTVQHAGVVLGVGGIADHAFRGLAADAPGYMMHAIAAQQISAVTGACMLVRREAFDAVGGFDDLDLPVAFNDIDLCMKLTAAGWEIIFTPDAVAEHRESMSRGDDFEAAKVSRFMLENEVMLQRYVDRLAVDPFYNRHFSRDGGVYRELRLLEPKAN